MTKRTSPSALLEAQLEATKAKQAELERRIEEAKRKEAEMLDRSHKRKTAIAIKDINLKLDEPVPLSLISKFIILRTADKRFANKKTPGREREWLLANHRNLPDADFGFELVKGRQGTICIRLGDALTFIHRVWAAHCEPRQTDLFALCEGGAR